MPSRRSLTWLLPGLALALCAPAAADPPSVERGPYLNQVTPTGIVVRWRTAPKTESRVRYGLAPGSLNQQVLINLERVTEHEVPLSGLTPDTRYYYAIGDMDEDLAGDDADHWFETSPLAGTTDPVRIWVVGDYGQCGSFPQGCIDSAAVRDAYLGFTGANPADLWVMLGDNAYDKGRDHEYDLALFHLHPEVLRTLPFFPVPGNHDFKFGQDSETQTGTYYEFFTMPKNAEAGGVASGTEAYYSYDYANIHFVALDSEDTDRSVGAPMYQWLEADLASTDQDWIIVYWHHPPYTKGSHDSDTEQTLIEMRQNYVALLEDHGVDLHLTGHSHSYERSFLIRGHTGFSSSFSGLHLVDGGDGDPAGDGAYVKPSFSPNNGAVYAVVGSSSKLSNGSLDHPAMATAELSLGSMVIDVSDTTLDARFIDSVGAELDHFRITKGLGSACDNGLDDDGDGFIDRIEDIGCDGFDDTSEAEFADDFQAYQPGDDPLDWFDTEALRSLEEDDSLFEVMDAGAGERSFGTVSEETNIHSHWVGPAAGGLTNYEYSGRMRMQDALAGIGVTFFSQFPADESYYRLRRFFSTDFQLAPIGTQMTGGDVSSGVVPLPGVWYRFRIRVEDTGSRTEIRARVWEDGTAEPGGWQVDAWDDSATRLTFGSYGVWSFWTGDKEWDDLDADPIQTALPACTDGVDNDDDGRTDWDGGGVGAADATCAHRPWHHTESAGCGLGFEVAPLLLGLAWRGRRRTRRAA